MAKIYTWRFSVRTYELDEFSQVKLMALQNYLEEAAMQASASNGYDYGWYRRNNRVWVARTIALRYCAPVTYPAELEVRTWVSDYRRVQSNREYDMYRVSDGARVLRGRCNWVYIDSATRRPQRLPANFMSAFEPDGSLELLDVEIASPVNVQNGIAHTEQRQVQMYEIDAAGHVNNAFYVAWAEQAITNLLRNTGWTRERLAQDDVAMYPVGRIIDYIRGAVQGEALRVETRLAQVGGDRAAWQTEIRTSSGELLARDLALRAFSDPDGPRSIPDALFLALTKR